IGANRLRHVVVKQLTDPRRKVTRVAKCLRHALLRRYRLSEDLRIRQNAGGVRIKTSQKRVSARSTQWKSAVSPIEPNPAGRQAINVRRFRPRVTVATQEVVKIIRNKEQDVRVLRISGVCRLLGDNYECRR